MNSTLQKYFGSLLNALIGLSPVAAVALATAASAGVKFTAEVVDSKSKLPLTIYLEKTKVRLDGPSPMDKTQEYRVLYDTAANTLAYLDMKRKTVFQMPVAQLEMLAALASKMSKTKIPPAAPAKYQFKDMGKTKIVGTWSCKRYELHRNGAKHGEVCTASITDLGLTKEDLLPLQKLSNSLQPLTKTISGAATYPDFLWEKIDERGLALEANAKESGQGHSFVMKTIEKKSLPNDTFDVPPGYKPQLIVK
jgi:hypothetical protein